MQNTKSDKPNAFVPYLAMQYFDRFLSRNAVPNVIGSVLDDVVLVTICCLSLACKMRDQSFSFLEFLEKRNLRKDYENHILVMELHILNRLNWRMRAVIATSFVPFFIRKSTLESIRLRVVNEIIIQAQDISFTQVRPSVIAASAVIVACRLLIPEKNERVPPYLRCTEKFIEDGYVTKVDLDDCCKNMLNMSKQRHLFVEEIEKLRQRCHVGEASTSSSHNPGIEDFMLVGETSTSSSHRAGKDPMHEFREEAEEAGMNFELKWQLDIDQITIDHNKKIRSFSQPWNDESRLQNLPDELCWEIVKRLPTKDAVRCSLISRRWSKMWLECGLDNLQIDDSLMLHSERLHTDLSTEQSPNFMRRVVGLIPLKDVKKVSLSFFQSYEPSEINWLLEALLTPNLLQLELNISHEDSIRLPERICYCTSLRVLKLSADVMVSHLPNVAFPQLKVLFLFVTETMDISREICRRCLVLEEMFIEGESFSDAFVRFFISSATIKRLRIQFSDNSVAGVGYKFVIKAKNLECIHLEDDFLAVCNVRNSPLLNEVTVCLRDYNAERLSSYKKSIFRFLRAISGVSYLSLCGWTSTVLSVILKNSEDDAAAEENSEDDATEEENSEDDASEEENSDDDASEEENSDDDASEEHSEDDAAEEQNSEDDAAEEHSEDDAAEEHLQLPTFTRLTNLEIEFSDCGSWEVLPYILERTPRLEVLNIKMKMLQNQVEDGGISWSIPDTLRLPHVKHILFKEFGGQAYELRAVEELLKTSQVLETMDINLGESRDLGKKVEESILSFPRLCDTAVVNIVKKKVVKDICTE